MITFLVILSVFLTQVSTATAVELSVIEPIKSNEGVLIESTIQPKDFVFTTKGDTREVQLQKVESTEYGVETFVRAFDVDGDPIGFGNDGSVEIERIRVVNPPVYVPDGTTYPCVIFEKKYDCPNYVLDPERALKTVIDETIDLIGKPKAEVILGKIGKTTTVVYPSATGNRPYDAYVRTDPGATGESWASARGRTSADGANDSDATLLVQIRGGTTSNQWRNIGRAIMGFDTSAIPDTDVISSATLSLWDQYSSTNPTAYGTQTVKVVGAPTPVSEYAVKNADYNVANWDVSSYSDTALTFSDWNGSNAYEVFTLNATGISNINLSTTTWLGLMSSSDFSNTAPTWANNTESNLIPLSSDNGGTTNDPKLTITHAEGAPPSESTASTTPSRFSTTTCTGTDPQVCVTEYIPEIYFDDWLLVNAWIIFLLSFPTIGFFFAGMRKT
ncbi:MAG: hypothetical protein H7836_15865 [Magnetococcus sp. YQC-3]